MAQGKRPIKVLCTLGPASLNRSTIERLEQRGVDLFRINLSHTPLEQVASTIECIQSISSVPICLDTEGAQVRTGSVVENFVVGEAQQVRLASKTVASGDGSSVTLTPESVFSELQPNHLVSLDFDGAVLLVLRVDAGGADTVALNGGKIGANKAVVVTPAPQLPALSEKDREAVRIGRQHGVTHFALSFTNDAADVLELRAIAGPVSHIISKIESKRGVLNLDGILGAADGILIDRGDLSREVPLENIPLLQKAIIRKANLAKVPVNVATNLLESMIANRKPTRAELNDIVNTLLDGANGLVLAAETAIGKHPVGAVDMVLAMIERHCQSVEGYRIEDLLDVTPLRRSYPARTSREAQTSRRQNRNTAVSVARLPAIEVDVETASDIEHLSQGVYSPLRGFMTQAELDAVLDTNRLPSGEVWTMPIVLQGKGQEFAAFQPGQSIRLVDHRTGQPIAVLHLEDKYEIDPQRVANSWFGTTDRSHPGVAKFLKRGLTLLGGPVECVGSANTPRSPYELTPTQTRMLFDIKGWTKIVAVHTSNVPHRGDEHILAHAAERSHADGVLVHAAVGQQNSGDFSTEAILGSWEQLIRLAFPKVLLAAFQTYSRFSGPREAVFTALCQRNFGCTHFVVGHDQGDADTFYPAQATRELFESLGDIGITPVFFDTVYFSGEVGTTVESTGKGAGLTEISGTEIRHLLAENANVPERYLRNEVAGWLADEHRAGMPLFAASE